MAPRPQVDEFKTRSGDEVDIEAGYPTTTAASAEPSEGELSAKCAVSEGGAVSSSAVRSSSEATSSSSSSAFLRRLCLSALWLCLCLSVAGVLAGLVWYTMGLTFLVQLALVAFVAFLAAGRGYWWLYVAIRTGPRDLLALVRYLMFLWTVRKYSKRDMCIGQIFRERAALRPDKVAFIYEDREWTFSQVEDYSNRVANLFKSAGFGKGDCVGLMLSNRPEFVCLWLGLSKVGVITALINHNQRQTALQHSINSAKCQALIYGEEFSEAVGEIRSELSGVELYCWSEAGSEQGLHQEVKDLHSLLAGVSSAPPNLEHVSFHDRLIYIYTSGTTGLPKPAVITHARYLFLGASISYMLWLKESDVFYTAMPLYHTAAGAMSVGQVLFGGSTLVIKKKFSASTFFSDICKYKCTVSQYIGEMCRYLLATPKSPSDTAHSLRVLFGNGLRPQIWKEFVERFQIPQIGEFYGATEGNANIVNTDNTVGAIGFVSRILPQVYPISIIKVDQLTGEPIRGPDGLCIVCEPNEPGVFIGKINPNNPARNYLGYVNEKESEKKVVRDVFSKGDAAFLSGDIVVGDEFGYLFFKDRTGDTFRWKGENVSTSEVEGIISNIIDYRDCVVYGVQVPNCDGRAGMAAILDKDNTLDLKKLAEGVTKALPSYARPQFLRILQNIELTGTFKMRKVDLQKEGFDPSAIEDKLYYLASGQTYQPLDSEVFSQLQSGKIRI